MEYVWVEFDGLRVKSILDACGLSPNNPVYHAKSKDLREEMMNEMIYITQNRDSSPIHLIGHLYLFLDYLASFHCQCTALQRQQFTGLLYSRSPSTILNTTFKTILR